MRSIVGILGLLVFLVLAYLAAGSYIDGIKAKTETKCSETRQTLGLCEPGK